MNATVDIHENDRVLGTEGGLADTVIQSVGDTTSRVISISSLDTKPSVNFILEKNEGVFINLIHYLDPVLFRNYLDTIFANGYYFTDLKYSEIMDVLYDFEKLEKYREDIRINKKDPVIKIASGIKTFDSTRTPFYRKPIISQDKRIVDYHFETIYTEECIADKITEVKKKLNIDEFIAAMWNYGIRFGLDIEVIKKAIEDEQLIRLPISRELSPTEGIDAINEPAISFEINRGVKNASEFKVDYLEYEQGYIRVNKDTIVYRKKPGIPGKPGWTIAGYKIDPKAIDDVSIDSLVGVGVRKEVINGMECLVANYNGFPRLEEDFIIKGRQKVKGVIKVHVEEAKVFDKGINVRTSGKVTLTEEIVVNENIVLNTEAHKIVAKKDVEANIRAIGDVTIEGNVIGVAQSNMLSEQHQRVSGQISKGNIVSEHGDISVKGYINDAYLEAKRGSIKLGNVTNSIIIGKTVEITGTAFNSIIIADTIILNGRTIGCKLIAGRDIGMKESTLKGYFENSVSIFSRDLTNSIEKKEELRTKLITQIQDIESKIDKEIIDQFHALTKIESGKRMSMTRTLVELMQDPEKLKQEQYKGHLAVYNLIRSVLIRHSIDWKKVKDINDTLTQLSVEIKTEKDVMEGYQKQLSMKIGYIQGVTYTQRIKFLENKQILELSLEDIIYLSALIAGRDVSSRCILEKIEQTTTSKFEWINS